MRGTKRGNDIHVRLSWQMMYTEASAKSGLRVSDTFVRATSMAVKRHRNFSLSHSTRSQASRLPCVITQVPERVHPNTVSAPGRGYVALNRRMGRLQSMSQSAGAVSIDEEERTLVKVIVAGIAG